jgi:hypothetical protein
MRSCRRAASVRTRIAASLKGLDGFVVGGHAGASGGRSRHPHRVGSRGRFRGREPSGHLSRLKRMQPIRGLYGETTRAGRKHRA